MWPPPFWVSQKALLFFPREAQEVSLAKLGRDLVGRQMTYLLIFILSFQISFFLTR